MLADEQRRFEQWLVEMWRKQVWGLRDPTPPNRPQRSKEVVIELHSPEAVAFLVDMPSAWRQAYLSVSSYDHSLQYRRARVFLDGHVVRV
jgi:hypothetical protein